MMVLSVHVSLEQKYFVFFILVVQEMFGFFTAAASGALLKEW